jgi:transcriptional regulator with XRE-family HTH domain
VVDSENRMAHYWFAMETTATPTVRFNGQLMAEDCALKGWTKSELAERAEVSDMTVIRFLRGQNQTGKTAKALAEALGQSPERYLVSAATPQAVGQ